MNGKNSKFLARLNRQKQCRGFGEVIMEKLAKWSLALTGAGALVLVSNLELGTAGSWAKVALGGIVCYWLGLIAYARWMERDKQRRQERERTRFTGRVLDEAERLYYIRETLAA